MNRRLVLAALAVISAGAVSMAADLSGPKAIESRDGYAVALPMASNEVIWSGALVTFDRSGLKAYEADDHGTSDFLCAGIAAESADNSGTSYESGKTIRVRRGVFAVGRATNALTRAYLGKLVYIADNQTVTPFGVPGSNTVAGMVLDVDSAGKVWIDTRVEYVSGTAWTAASAAITGNASVGGALVVTGAGSVGGALTVTGAASAGGAVTGESFVATGTLSTNTFSGNGVTNVVIRQGNVFKSWTVTQ